MSTHESCHFIRARPRAVGCWHGSACAPTTPFAWDIVTNSPGGVKSGQGEKGLRILKLYSLYLRKSRKCWRKLFGTKQERASKGNGLLCRTEPGTQRHCGAVRYSLGAPADRFRKTRKKQLTATGKCATIRPVMVPRHLRQYGPLAQLVRASGS